MTDRPRNALAPAPSAKPAGAAGVAVSKPRRRLALVTGRDKLVMAVMVGVPLALDLIFIWGPTLLSLLLSFTNYRGVGALTGANFVGIRNYQTLLGGSYAVFYPALLHNIVWLLALTFIATPLGILLAVLLDRELRGSHFYQTVFYLPVVLSLAVVGLIWDLQYAANEGFINNAIGRAGPGAIDWLGDTSLNLGAVLVAASWRHIGYIMVLYLAGLKSVDPALRDAAKVDGATETQAFFRVVFPVMKPINIVIVVVTFIEALRAFDIVYIINKGKGGLELLSTLITNNSISEANLLGFGSAISVILLVISLVPIVIYLSRTLREAPG